MSSALVVTTMIAFVVASATAIPPSTRPVNVPPPSPVECRRYDGTVVEGLFPGGTKHKGCEYCHCDGHGQVTCAYVACIPPRCVNPQRGECCSTCPNGPNCRTKSGQIVGEGEEVVEPDGRVCFCSMNNPEAECSEPPRTTAPPSVCDTMDDGTPLAVGKEWRSPNGCKGCRCDSAGGKAVCWVQDCAPVPCANPVSTPGVCCPTCPNVETCKLASGEIITKGKILKKDGAVCKCRRKEDSGLAAVCIPTTKMEKMLKRLKAKLQAKKDQLSKKEIRKLNRRISRIQRQLN